jgi:hypothetical protein
MRNDQRGPTLTVVAKWKEEEIQSTKSKVGESKEGC